MLDSIANIVPMVIQANPPPVVPSTSSLSAAALSATSAAENTSLQQAQAQARAQTQAAADTVQFSTAPLPTQILGTQKSVSFMVGGDAVYRTVDEETGKVTYSPPQAQYVMTITPDGTVPTVSLEA